LLIALVATLSMATTVPAIADPTEQEVKAAMIINILRFVEWPEAAFSAPHAPIVVAIMGKDQVSESLDPMLRGKNVDGHPLEVRRLKATEDARVCQVLYIASSERRHTPSILEALGKSSTLTVSDFEDFVDEGGHIDLQLMDQRVHVIVNLRNVQDAHLKLSARLLSLAQIVGEAP
jgi:hypothetical protein